VLFLNWFLLGVKNISGNNHEAGSCCLLENPRKGYMADIIIKKFLFCFEFPKRKNKRRKKEKEEKGTNSVAENFAGNKRSENSS